MTTRVLIVDDDADIREMIHYALEEEGYEVLEAGDGDTTLRLLRESEEPLVVLLDLELPKRDGADVLRCVSQEPRLKQFHAIILMSASYRLPLWLEQLMQSLGVPSLQKPFDISDLLNIVQLQGRRLSVVNLGSLVINDGPAQHLGPS